MSTTTDAKRGPADSPREVLELLGTEAALYAKLESYAAKQRALVDHEDTDPLLSVLAARQQVTRELARVGTRLAPFRRDWQSCRRRFTPSQRGQVEELLRSTSSRLRRIIEGDERDARLLSARKQVVAHGMRATHATGQALAAYGAQQRGKNRVDRLDEAS